VLQGAAAERVFAGQIAEAEAVIERELAPDALEHDMGEVYLVGAGPGDPDLLTFRGLRLMQQADVVVYDRLVAEPILQMTRRDARRIYVGKQRNHHAMRQEEINRLLADLAKDGHRVLRLKGGDPFIFGRGGEEIDTLASEGVPFQVIPGITAASGCAAYAGKRRNEHTMRQEQINLLLVKLAREGKQVVRLKGGDPFIFGRGGEEMQVLAEHGIDFEVVPGITAACGVSSYSGIPLTHRDHAQSCLFVTGHLKDGSADLDWEALVRPRQTVVIYMGLNALADICRQLVKHGAPPSRPIAVVQHGTIATQQVLTGTLADLPQRVAESGFTSPSLIIVGDVVQLHGSLAWFNPVASQEKTEAALSA